MEEAVAERQVTRGQAGMLGIFIEIAVDLREVTVRWQLGGSKGAVRGQ